MTTTNPADEALVDLSTIPITPLRVRKGRKGDLTTEVPARIVTPGLAVTPHIPSAGEQGEPPTLGLDTPGIRYNVTHIPSGLSVFALQCSHHVREAVRRGIESGIDWTAGRDTVIAAMKTALDSDVGTFLFRTCRPKGCVGDPPEPPPWGVHCNTCDWEWEDEYDEGSLTFEEARRMASDHECEPRVEIAAPGSDTWRHPWQYTSDGKLREDAKRQEPATGGGR